MQIKSAAQLLALATAVSAATTKAQEENSSSWTTLKPTATYSGATSDYSSSFGIAIEPITTGSLAPTSTSSAKASSKAKRDVVSQITDGQVQATTKPTGKPSSKAPEKPKGTAPAVSQITDGQVQATTKTLAPAAKPKPTTNAASQSGDGQVQATTGTAAPAPKPKPTTNAASQIGDGQVQATTGTEKPKTSAASQISDGQIQATTGSASAAKATGASQVSDGQIQASGAPKSSEDQKDGIQLSACATNGTLSMTLKDGILYDSHGRVGSIVANRQFQFDGPPPQAGAIYANGWSITPDGNLAIGDNDVFYKCLSGNFYNLYDETLGAQCSAIHLNIVSLTDC